jgi:hypothetical protein
MELTHEQRSRVTAAGNATRLRKKGYTFKHAWQVRGGQVSMHVRYHSEKFSPRCVICLEELNAALFPLSVNEFLRARRK